MSAEVIVHPSVKRGSAAKYKAEYGEQMIAYFAAAPQVVTQPVKITTEEGGGKKGVMRQEVQQIVGTLPTFERFAYSIGTHRETLRNWAKAYPEFGEAYKACQDLVRDFMLQGLVSGRIPGMGGIFVAKNVTDMTDDRTLTVASAEPRDKPALAERTPAQLEALKAAVMAAEAAGVRLVIADE